MNPIFLGRIDKGKVSFQNRPLFDQYIKSFKDGTLLEIIVKKFKETKSDPLRKYYFGVVMKLLSEETGYTKDEMHDAMKAKFASTYGENDLLIIQSVFSNKSKMSIEDKQDFIEQVKRWAATYLSLYIPDPNEVEYKKIAKTV